MGIKERRTRGPEPDPFDPQISLTANVRAAMTTGNAIFLSALTTIVGFSVLTWHSLVPIEPMRTVGNTLLIGISATFIISMLMVPAWIEPSIQERGLRRPSFKRSGRVF